MANLVAIHNTREVPCQRCGQVHPFYTKDDRVLLVTEEKAAECAPNNRTVLACSTDVFDEIERAGFKVGWT